MVRSISYYQVDTFTRKAFSGEPVAVITQSMGLSDEEMQLIGNELNLSGVVFVLPSIELSEAFNRLRHFQAAGEVLYLDHTTLASIWVIVCEKWLPVPINGSLFLKIELPDNNPTPVEIRCAEGNIYQVMLPAAIPVLSEPPIELVENTLDMMNLSSEDLDEAQGIYYYEALQQLLLPLRTKKTLFEIQFDEKKMAELDENYPLIVPYVYRRQNGRRLIHTRNFSSEHGTVAGIPHCSAASAASVAALLNESAAHSTQKIEFIVEQGNPEERQLRIFVEVFFESGLMKQISVGGSSFVVMTGKLLLDDD